MHEVALYIIVSRLFVDNKAAFQTQKDQICI